MMGEGEIGIGDGHEGRVRGGFEGGWSGWLLKYMSPLRCECSMRDVGSIAARVYSAPRRILRG